MVGQISEKIKGKDQERSGEADQYQKANTFDGAGQEGQTQDAPQTEPTAEVSRKLVVLGRESVFSQEIIDYAIEMAERMSYEIIALNTAPLSCETFELFADSRDKICEDFEALSQKSVQVFQEAAEKKKIPFTHIIKYSDADEVLKTLKHEIGEYEFVVSEMGAQANVDGTENDEGVRRQICVYTIL